MLDKRPHILKYQVLTDGYEDNDGNWIAGKSEFVGEIPCRAVPNGKAVERLFEDGKTFVYSHTIYLDCDIEIKFFAGELIQVFDSKGRKLLEKPIHGNPEYRQLGAKIYV